ncbi:putative spermatogenesis-associated protein 31C2 [Cavia porcellus]|uniref:putative spermatogenesis-associated protein 31C2 n=1 Tax=Cavia porcellus TaxID=10141 RepID=UPI002FE32BDF
MENFLTPLKSLSATWPSFTIFAMDMVLAFVCGLGLYLLLLPWLPGEPSLPPSRRNRTIKKRPVRIRWNNRSRKRTGALRDCQIYQKLDNTLSSLLRSFQKLLPEQESPQQPPHPQCLPAVCTSPPATALQPHGKDVHTTTLSVVEAASSPPTRHLLPLASSPSPGWSTISSDLECSPTALTASQSPEPLLLLDRISPRPLSHSLPPMGPFKSASGPQPWWDTTEKPNQQLSTHQPSHPKIPGLHFEQKWNQPFWGLPSQDNESLVAAAWISPNPSVPQLPSSSFNKTSHFHPIHRQNMSSLLPQAQAPYCLEPQLPPQFQPPLLGYALTRTHPWSSPPILLSPPVSHSRDCGAACSAPHSTPQSQVPTEIQHPGWPLSTKQLERGGAVLSAVQSAQEGHSRPTSSLHQGKYAAVTLPGTFLLSPEVQAQLEQHIQRQTTEHSGDQASRTQGSAGLTQPPSDLTLSWEAKDKAGPSHLRLSTAESSQDGQMRFQPSTNPVRNLGHILGNVPKDLSRASGSYPDKDQGVPSEESERTLIVTRERDTGNDSPGSADRGHIEDVLKVHLGTKTRQIHQGLIPLRVRLSWLSVNGAFSTSDTHVGTRKPASSRAQETYMKPTQKFSVCDPSYLQDLETQIGRFRVKHRWGLPLRLLKAANHFKPTKAQSLSLPQFSPPSSSSRDSWVDLILEDAEFLGETPEAFPEEEARVRESVSPLGSPLVSPLASEETNLDPTGIPLADGQWLSEGPLSGQDSKGPSEQLTHRLRGTTHDSKTVQMVGEADPTVPLLPGTYVSQDAGEPGDWADITRTFQHTEMESMNSSQKSGSGSQIPDSLVFVAPQSHHHNRPESQRLGDLMAHRGSSLGQQKPRDPMHQCSQKSHSRTFAPTFKQEVSRGTGAEKHEGRLGRLASQDWRKQGPLEREHPRHLPQKQPVPSEGRFQRSLKKFLQWFLPTKKMKGQEDAPKKGKPAGATARSWRLAPGRLRVDRGTYEAQVLMTPVGQMLETKISFPCEVRDLKLDQHRQEGGQDSVSQAPCSLEHRGAAGYVVSSGYRSHGLRERPPQESLKTGQQGWGQQGQRLPHPSVPIKPVSPDSPAQHGQLACEQLSAAQSSLAQSVLFSQDSTRAAISIIATTIMVSAFEPGPSSETTVPSAFSLGVTPTFSSAGPHVRLPARRAQGAPTRPRGAAARPRRQGADRAAPHPQPPRPSRQRLPQRPRYLRPGELRLGAARSAQAPAAEPECLSTPRPRPGDPRRCSVSLLAGPGCREVARSRPRRDPRRSTHTRVERGPAPPRGLPSLAVLAASARERGPALSAVQRPPARARATHRPACAPPPSQSHRLPRHVTRTDQWPPKAAPDAVSGSQRFRICAGGQGRL